MPVTTTDRLRDHPPVLAAGLLLRRKAEDGPRWLLLCNSRNGEWGFPKGHAEPGEDLRQTALRECAEECGIGLLAMQGEPLELSYPVAGRVKTVTYWPAITAQQRFRLSHEHRDGAWMTADAVLARLPHANLGDLFQRHLATLG